MKDRPSTTTLRTRREVLRRRRRERQILFFGAIIVGLGAVSFAAYNVYQGKMVGPFAAPFVTNVAAFSSDVKLPCPEAGWLPLPANEVIVRVLNSTGKVGLAGTTMADLVGRGFVSAGTGNFKRFEYEGVARIAFGADGVQQAYTLARHFSAPELVLDSRKGYSVDIVLGVGFDKLVPLYSPDLAPDLELSAPGECLPAALISAEPAPQRYPSTDPSPSPSASVSPTAGGTGNDPGGD